MAAGERINIIIVAEKSPRAETLTSLIRDGISKPVDVKVASPVEVVTESIQIDADVCIVDLMSSEGPVSTTINQIRQKQPGSKIIALHIYKSPELVQPLYKIGIDGYLYHDPPKKELAVAIERVLKGEVYVPPFLEISKKA
jgi:two-component system, NarL family, response regulator DesR